MKRRGIISVLCAIATATLRPLGAQDEGTKKTSAEGDVSLVATDGIKPTKFGIYLGEDLESIEVSYKGEKILLTPEEIMRELR